MSKQTTRVPKLVNPEYLINATQQEESFNIFNIFNIFNYFKKLSLDFIILILFIFFLIFFLVNCKYGIFKDNDLEPIPYTFSQIK